MLSFANDRHMLVQGLVNAGKRFGDIVQIIEMDTEVANSSIRSSKNRKSRSRSNEAKKPKHTWVPVDEAR